MRFDKPNLMVQIKFGSHLYGTSTPASDLDIKGLHIPTARDILIQKIQPVINSNRSKGPKEKNTSEDVDYEYFSPGKYLALLAAGQTVALDMLFAPTSSYLDFPDIRWTRIKEFSRKILTKKTASFVGYCRNQAYKYGVKGDRVGAARLALDFLLNVEQSHGGSSKLGDVASEVFSFIAKHPDKSELLSHGIDIDSNDSEIPHLRICGRKAAFTASIKSAREIAQGLVNEYGDRALAAEMNNGVDWKGLSHAVRIASEAIEFLTTEHITFPRPEAAYLLDIKLGKVSPQIVGNHIDQLLVDVETALAQSKLPEGFDQSLIDNFIEEMHREIVLEVPR